MAFALAALLTIGWTGAAVADTWMPPRVETYVSADKAVRLTVTPGSGYGGEPATKVKPARGVLERRGASGRWTPVWDQPLLNPVAPTHALVAADGDHVVTFDNWFSIGTGPNVVVLYGPGGTLVRSLRLTDIVPETYVESLPRSVSSLNWGGEHRLEGPDLILRVNGPGIELEPTSPIEIKVDLATGQVRPPSGPAWDAALAKARQVVAQRREEQAREIAWMTDPLVGPSSEDQQDWHQYLVEAYFRLMPGDDGGYPTTLVLRRPQAADYAPSLGWLRETVNKRGARPGDVLMLASPDPDNLVAVLADVAAQGRAKGLKGLRVYVAADDARWPAVVAALGGSGAALIQLDPGKPIPQRPERVPHEPSAEWGAAPSPAAASSTP